MPIKKRVVQSSLMGKFGFIEVEGSEHDAVSLFVQGKKIATTRFSRGHREISDDILGLMAKQIGVNLATFKNMIGCTVELQEYLRILRQRHPSRFE
jgi:hypothetical protein